jgi:HD domain
MTFSLDFPAGPVAEAALSVVRTSESPSIANHSLRTFFFAQLLAVHEGCLDDAAYDRELLFAATVMHDLGLGDLARGADRFEVEGADLAAAVLREHGVPDQDVDRVWEAVALHTSAGIAERRGLLAYLTRRGVGIDFGQDALVVNEWEREIHAAYPRLAMARSLADEIVRRATGSPAAAPPYSLGAGLLRERRTDGITAIERAVASSPWAE